MQWPRGGLRAAGLQGRTATATWSGAAASRLLLRRAAAGATGADYSPPTTPYFLKPGRAPRAGHGRGARWTAVCVV